MLLCFCTGRGFCILDTYLSLLAIVSESESGVLLCSLSRKVTGVHCSGATQCGEKSLVCIAAGEQHIVHCRRGATQCIAAGEQHIVHCRRGATHREQGSNTPVCSAGEQHIVHCRGAGELREQESSGAK